MKRTMLKAYRNQLGYTQTKMAQCIGITLSFYTKIELGLKNPSVSTIKKFTQAFPTANANYIFLS